VTAGHRHGVLEEQADYGPDVNGVRYMSIYGIKGLAAYAAHAAGLGEHDPWVPRFMYQVRIHTAEIFNHLTANTTAYCILFMLK